MTQVVFRYCSGEQVRVGDRVRVADHRHGVVKEIAQPGTAEADGHGSETGGILVAEDWDGVESYVFLEPEDSPAGWEDTAFVERGPASP